MSATSPTPTASGPAGVTSTATPLPEHGLEIRLATRPRGWPTGSTFDIVRAPVRPPRRGEILVRNLLMSVDPYMRTRMENRPSYVPPFQLGKPLEGGSIGEVVASTVDSPAAGDLVFHQLGWREYAVLPAGGAQRVDPAAAPLAAYLGVLGIPGLSAYVGLLDIASMRAGDVVFVSGAYGAVGSLAGQIARLRGASRVIGSAGTDDKVDYVTRELRFDTAFNYRDGDLPRQLRAAAPGGIDVYLDNVGGDHLEAAISAARVGARFALCGTASHLNDEHAPTGPRNLAMAISKRLTLRGFLVSDHLDRMPAFVSEVGEWIKQGEVRYTETTVDGLGNAPDALLSLLRGHTSGRVLIRIAEPAAA